MMVSKKSRAKKIKYYTALADQYHEQSPDWHYWMQHAEHWRRINQRL